MKQGSLYETFIQLAALVFAFIVVQATYTTVIRPVALTFRHIRQSSSRSMRTSFPSVLCLSF